MCNFSVEKERKEQRGRNSEGFAGSGLREERQLE